MVNIMSNEKENVPKILDGIVIDSVVTVDPLSVVLLITTEKNYVRLKVNFDTLEECNAFIGTFGTELVGNDLHLDIAKSMFRKELEKKKDSVPTWLQNIITKIDEEIKHNSKSIGATLTGLILARNIIRQETRL